MAEITIRGKRGEGKFVIVDDSLFEELNKTSWYLDRYGYAVTIPQKEERGNGTRLMHRIIIKAPKGKIVDHINGNRLDNRLENLRIITTKENTYNVQKSKLTTAKSDRSHVVL